MKKLSHLIAERDRLLRQARLANLALAYQTINKLVERITRARLVGPVTLKPVSPHEESFCATLTALEGSQSVIEEHFTDEDLIELADVIGFVTGNDETETSFRLEEAAELFLVPLREELKREGVVIDRPVTTVEESESRQA
jgi:hypothetical protein